jgi:hypothetical protein
LLTIPRFLKLAMSLSVALAFASHGPVNASVSTVDRLTDQLKRLQSQLDTNGAGLVDEQRYAKLRVTIQKRMRDDITTYVWSQLRTADVNPATLAASLMLSIKAALTQSWADHPAYVFALKADKARTLVVAFTLGQAAVGSTSEIQVYRENNGTFSLTGDGGHEMNDCNMHIIRMVSDTGEPRLFAFGAIFGANRAISKGMLYAIRNGVIVPLWKMKDSFGLQARSFGGRLILEYQDAKKFSNQVSPNAFRDVYVQTGNGMRLASRTAEQ